jgi:hypothetical protein
MSFFKEEFIDQCQVELVHPLTFFFQGIGQFNHLHRYSCAGAEYKQ